ncbi:MAG: NAD(P)/FAD-dependent oxidoreductase [Rubrivivax sp.]
MTLADPSPQAPPIETYAVVIGAGPVGLFQVFELGLLEIQAHVIDSLPAPGGQCIELYPDKPIYDIPGLPFCTGRELTERLLQQIQPFGASFHLNQEVASVQRQADQRFLVQTSQGTRLLSKTVFIAGGVGAFQPRMLKVPGLERFHDRQVFYRVQDPAALAGQHVVVMGDDDTALEWALRLAPDNTPSSPQHSAQAGTLDDAKHARSVTLLHRRDAFRAASATVERMRARCQAGALRFVAGQIVGFTEEQGRLTHLQVTGADDRTDQLPVDRLLPFLGLSPKLGPIAQWGLAMERKQLVVDTEKFETSECGIFAVGDVNTYPGKKKLILCGFHEATLAAYGACAYVFPDQKVQLQYTTTSPQLHQLLGVSPGIEP